ncbi:MAG: hypothetical protein KAI28_08770, partial [Sphingomonadales bacterium]|nr:hypothetical protein [Sphingomonadales bacterium]
KKNGINNQQLVLDLELVGNTSSATIPLALTNQLSDVLMSQPQKLLMSGFGVGWSWGSIAMETHPMKVCKTVTVPVDYKGASL